MKIQQLTIKDFKGIEEADLHPGQLTLISGGNGQGKSSILDAIKAAFQGGDARLIRAGADKASIFVDLAELKITRTITEKGNYPKVTTADGMSPSSPQKFLATLLDLKFAFNPLEFNALKPVEQRECLLKLTQAVLTEEQVEAACGGLPPVALTGHGLDVAARLQKWFEGERTAAKAEAKRAEERVTVSGAAIPEGFGERLDAAGGVEDAAIDWGTEREASAAKLADLAAARRAVEQGRAKRAELGAKLAGARAESARARETERRGNRIGRDLPLQGDLEAEEARLVDALAKVRATLANVRAARKTYEEACIQRVHAEARIDELTGLLEALPALPSTTAEDEAALRATIEEREADLEALAAWDTHQANTAALAKAEEVVAAADKQVKFWMREMPARLLAAADLPIAGLSFDGDRVLVDGVDLAERSGSERLLMAVELFKRLNHDAQVKYVPADGLEQLDPETRAEFLAMAEADEEWQYIMTVVTGPEGLPGSVVVKGGRIEGAK
uniref:Putative ATPase domain containing protein n=1 Tax=viral metagenome TaxID=1070528 RepID=A0A6M3J0Z8_9ZZZZ